MCIRDSGYSDEWKAEAARRGLDCETSVPVIFDNYLKPESIRIDVYKRQALQLIIKQNVVYLHRNKTKGYINQPIKDKMTRAIKSVSYTHLDVYKRQRMHWHRP